ncbi:dihydrofolate reductase family protein [Candidatus Gottesmanbacteria bacterium]|nr:dihydrofolate reductase family protein [Candidatus Gottesmanbacteria bacterium]
MGKNFPILQNYLKSQHLISIATLGNEIWNCTVYFAIDDDLNFYFISKPTTTHCQNITKNQNVACTIVDSRQKVTDKKIGVQFNGIAERLTEVNDIKMAVNLWMSMSLNGIISREKGEEDFISHGSWLLWLDVIRKSGNFIFGRKAYENLMTWDKKYLEALKGLRIVVVTNNSTSFQNKDFTFVSSPQEALDRLKSEDFESITLTGGATLNSSFAKLNLIDEIILNVEPVIIGNGIPVFHPDLFNLKLEFLAMQKTNADTILLHYKVKK